MCLAALPHNIVQISVIIPVYNAIALAKECVGGIFAAGSDLTFEVIVVDNGSAPEVEEWLLLEEGLRSNLRHLRYPEPLGFARAVNAGAALATGEILIVLNSDTLVTPGWMDGLNRALHEDPSLGAVTPSTNQAGEPAQMDNSTADLPASKAFAVRSRKAVVPGILYLPQRLTFFCVALRREVWLQLEGFDESYRVGNFEDDDLCLRLRVAGYRLGVARHVFVYHHNRATFQANRISHSRWMAENAAVFAARARQLAEARGAASPRWPKRIAHDISVVILAREGAPLDRTLRSLHNQTVREFEIVPPDSREAPTRSWIAWIAQGDILYPFHLEALLDALDRRASEAVFADVWMAGAKEASAHPDASRLSRKAPLLLAGWMHHSSLDRDRLWEQCEPLHWPRITWEMHQAPVPEKVSPSRDREGAVQVLVEWARRLYRRRVRLETRLAIEARLRKLFGRVIPEIPLQRLAERLEALKATGAETGKFASHPPAQGCRMPAVFMFNIVPWDGVVQRSWRFACGLARSGHQVFWVDSTLRPARNWWTGRPLREIAPGVHLVHLPGVTRDIYHMPWTPAALNAMSAALTLIASAYGVREAVSLVSFPRWQPLVKRLRDRAAWKIVYDCLDDQQAFADLFRTQLGNYEDWLVDSADLLFTSSVVLRERLRRPAILLHNAADYDLFSSRSSAGHLRHLPRPVIGFFGVLADWLDMDLIHAAAVRFPGWSFVYIGPRNFSGDATETQWLRSTNLPNITVLPQMDPVTLADYLADFDVCIMPFLDIPVTRTMNAVKLYEYLAAGKPTISRDLPEVRHLAGDLIVFYTTPDEFFERLREAVAADSPDLAARRQRFARQNDWSERVDVLSRKIVELAG
jgi:GT2 family glycosyltransferase/glycosyltransferase involved in cell wall biosynthesis